MTVTVLDRALVAGDAGRVTGERQERPDPEVPERARRRSFTAQYKLEQELAKARFVVDVQAKLQALLETISEGADTEPGSTS
jgi:transposase